MDIQAFQHPAPYQSFSQCITFSKGLIGYCHLKTMSFSQFGVLGDYTLFLLQSRQDKDQAWILCQGLDNSLLDDGASSIYYMVKPAYDENHLEMHVQAPLYINHISCEGEQKILPYSYHIKNTILGNLKDVMPLEPL